jgi:hypothetical protein
MTLAETFLPRNQRPRLLEFLSAIDASRSALGRGGCGDWAICGRDGHVFAVPEGFQLIVLAGSARKWANVKKHLSFWELTQDGDDEGGFILDCLRRESEAALIREATWYPQGSTLKQRAPRKACCRRV